MTSRAAVLVALAGLFAAPARAAEPHLEFARALRENGLPDLAADYLQRLDARKLPADVAALVPLEVARARLDVATQEGDAGKRAKQFAAARAAYEAFLKAHPTHPRAAEAKLDLARLVALEGKHLLGQARRQASKSARKDLTAKAAALFDEAATQLKGASAEIDKRLGQLAAAASDAEKAQKADLTRAKFQAQLDEAINLINQSNALVETKDAKGRAKVIADARAVLVAVSKAGDDNPLSWQAKVWLGRLAEEIEAKPEAVRRYTELTKEQSPAAAEAARTAAFLLLRLQAEDERVPDRAGHVRQVVNGCEDWLKKYRTAVNTPEGQGVRYVLATLLEEQARPGIVRPQSPPDAPPRVGGASRQLLVRAERLYKELTETDNDYTEKARARRAGVLVVLMAERSQDVGKLANFEECYLTAQVDAYELTQGKKSDDEKSKHLARIVAALKRGLGLAARADNPRDVADARLMLTYAYLTAGEPYYAAVLGEHLSRSNLAGPRGPEAAAYALQAYAAILDGDRRRNATEDEKKADQRRLRALAGYMEKTWPDDAATDVARHQLGAFLIDDKNYPEAIAMLGRIAPTYPGLAQARYQEGVAAQKAQSAEGLAADRKKALLKQAIADLEKVPDPAPGGSEETALAACEAKLEYGNLLLLDERPDGANYARAEAVANRIAALTPELALDESVAPQVAAEAAKLRLAGVCGKALLLLRADRFDDARAALAPLVAAVEKGADAKDVYEPLREAQRQVVALALRAAILENKAADADKALTLLRRISPPSGSGSANDRLLRVVVELKREADAFKEKGQTAKRERLEGGLIGFVDELAKAPNLRPDVRMFLASAYASLDQHKKAAGLLKDYPPPKSAEGDEAKRYQAVRVALMRESRLGGDQAQALAALNDALKSWGKSNLDVQRERVFLLEDAGNFNGAVKASREMQDALKKGWTDYERAVRDEKAAEAAEARAKTDEERTKAQQAKTDASTRKAAAQPLRDAYWEFYFYEIRIVLKNDQKRAKDAADKERRLGVIATAIKKLEDGQEDFGGKDLRDKYRAMVDGEPVLKQKYLEAHGKRL
ncbi:MAG TPA: hypothetical protein VGF55_02050, partial [Gemmataceae bacterium]